VQTASSKGRNKMKFFLAINRKQPKGFSLIDLLVAMTLTSLLIMGMAQLMCHSILVKRKTDCSVRAAELACQKIEHFRTKVLNGEVLDPTQSEKIEDTRVNHTFRRDWAISEVSAEVKRIEVQCYPLNYPRKRTRLPLTLSIELGF
jgi:Tfp pilus assembly protein PilV